jgi:hypothetical protein
MTTTYLTASIGGTIYPVRNGSYQLSDKVDARSTLSVVIYDATGSYTFQFGQPIVITDYLEGVRFTGFIQKSSDTKIPAQPAIWHTLDCMDNHFLADKRTSNRIYNNQYTGVIAASMANDVLASEGVTTNYAIRDDNTQTEFGQGTLSGTVATGNLGGDLELALAGSDVTIVESTTSNFGTGSLNNVTSANNTLVPTSTPAIKMVATQSVPQNNNSYTYVKIWQPASSFQILSGRYFAYDIWIDGTSPQCKFGVDIIFTDGTNVRDNSLYNDAQNIPPHPSNDLAGLAKDQWYHREFYLDNFAGKYLAYVAIACEGDTSGTYIAYFKNIKYENNDHSLNQWFFSTSLGVNPAQQMQMNGYSNTQVTVVNTYDSYLSGVPNRISGSYSINAAKILKGSFITWKATVPDNTSFSLLYSIDGGSSWCPCTKNASLPNLPPGMSIAGKSIEFKEEFFQLPGANPEQPIILNSVECVIYSSYSASKADVLFATTSGWGGTKSHTTDNSYTLNLTGSTRNWDDGSDASQGLYGGSGVGYYAQVCDQRAMSVRVDNTYAATSRLDFAGTWSAGIIEVDVYVETNVKLGVSYLTTNWSNYDANYAYAVEVSPTAIALQKGSNSSQSQNGTRTQLASTAITLTSGNWYHLKVVFGSGSHTIYLNDEQEISVSDSTYTSAGYIGLRASNGTGSTHTSQFDNFGVMSALSGTWISANTSIAGAGTYGTSVVWWDDDVSNNLSAVLVEASLDNGSNYSTVTNGSAIPALAYGQSLSGVSVKFRVTLTTSTASAMPGIRYFNVYVIGHFSSSGTRIAPVLSLSNALVAGSTAVNWTVNTPTNTSVTVATSLDGSSWSTVSNGGAIAGIASQAAALLDTFSNNTSAYYTSTCESGGSNATWTWNTTNSRLISSGGTNALLLVNSPTNINDVVAHIDLSVADAFGIAINYADPLDFFYVEIHDNAAGSDPGMAYMYNLSYTLYPLDSSPIDFPRGTYHRFQFSCLAGVYTLCMDGVQLISFDQNPYGLPSAGQVGLWNGGGSAYCYQLYVQPQGQSLSGVNAYTKVTLSSSNPTVTPQLTDLVLCALNPNIGLGSLVPTVAYQYTYLSANFDDLAKKSGTYYWLIDQNLNFIFSDRVATPAPWILQSSDPQLLLAGPLTVEYSGYLYRNRHTVTGVNATGLFSETKIGDGTSTSWALGNNVESAPTIKFNGILQTVGQKGIDTGKDFYYEIGNNTIYQDSSGTVLQQTDILGISYTGQYTTSVSVDNTGIAGTVTQSQFKSTSGGTGIVEVVEDVSSQNLDIATATNYCTSMLTRYGTAGRTLTFITIRTNPSLSIGQYLPMFIAGHSINNASMLITGIDTTQNIVSDGSGNMTQQYVQSVTATENANLPNLWKLIASTIN